MKKNKKRSRNQNRELHVVTYLFMTLFLLMMGYYAYYVAVPAKEEMNNSYNSRQENLAKKVVRGKILARDGDVLAETKVDENGGEERVYPYSNLFSHVVGYATRGRSGIESFGNISLLTSNAYIMERLENSIGAEKNIGDNLVTTLDVKLQKAANDALGMYRGAILAMEPDTGKILAMVSHPDFNPNHIAQEWETISTDTERSPLMNRATQGLYPPGSTFKMVTLLEYLKENPDSYGAYSYQCNGKIERDQVTVSCYHGTNHGEVDLLKSFAKSCNCSFVNIGLQLDTRSYAKTAKDLLFNQKLPVKFTTSKSSFVLDSGSDTEEIMHTAMGQGETLITPLHMAMITAAVANGGELMTPYVIDRIENYNHDVMKQHGTNKYGRLMSKEEADLLTYFMKDVIEEGTGTKLKGQPYTVAGKTGSAEYGGEEKGASHAWFTGFSATENPDLVVTVIVEGAGSGGDYAVPTAKRVFDAYYD